MSIIRTIVCWIAPVLWALTTSAQADEFEGRWRYTAGPSGVGEEMTIQKQGSTYVVTGSSFSSIYQRQGNQLVGLKSEAYWNWHREDARSRGLPEPALSQAFSQLPQGYYNVMTISEDGMTINKSDDALSIRHYNPPLNTFIRWEHTGKWHWVLQKVAPLEQPQNTSAASASPSTSPSTSTSPSSTRENSSAAIAALKESGQSFQAKGDLAQAETEYRKVLSLDPQDEAARLRLSQVLFEKGRALRSAGKHKEAEDALLEALQHDRQNGRTAKGDDVVGRLCAHAWRNQRGERR